MRNIHYLLLITIFFCSQIKATPNLFVPLNKVTFEADRLKLEVLKENHIDRISQIKITTPESSFKVSTKVLEHAYAINLQEIRLTQGLNLTYNSLGNYQLYIPYNLHSDDGTEPREEQNFEEYELVIYFTNTEIQKAYSRKM